MLASQKEFDFKFSQEKQVVYLIGFEVANNLNNQILRSATNPTMPLQLSFTKNETQCF